MPEDIHSLNILLSNGRFPVSIDLARQLKQAGHTVFVVDPMQFHACKASQVVKKSFQVPPPRDNAAGYIAAVKNIIKAKQIDLIIPLHEEIFHLAECGDLDILERLFAPQFGPLVRLHDKWQFNRFLKQLGLDYPKACLCRNLNDIQILDLTKEWALKPVFGRASGNIFHLKPDHPLPSAAELGITDEVYYTAQEWVSGSRYCSYSIVRDGKLRALAIYPVKDTLDSSSCVYFESMEHKGIRKYVERIVEAQPGLSGQIAFDFVETEDGRLVAIECNPRATSGIHLFAGTPDLAHCITDSAIADNDNSGQVLLVPREGARRQFLPGMMIVPWRSHGSLSEYVSHLKRLWTSRDVTFSVSDMLPLPTVLMQPLFLSCVGFCEGKDGMSAPDMFQEDLLWEPRGEYLEKVRNMLKEMD
ncbi:unnamed protein product [Calypogeia fissa]